MTALDFDRLDPVSRSFAEYVAELRPEWKTYLRTVKSPYGSGQLVELEFPNPEGCRAEHPLSVSTDWDEVTVCFDMHHTHFPWPDSYQGGDGRPAVLVEIEAFMREEAVVASIFSDGKLRISSRIRPDEIASYVEDPSGDSTLRVRSWHGRYDADFRVRRASFLRRLQIPVFR
jgi:hypothetical protein